MRGAARTGLQNRLDDVKAGTLPLRFVTGNPVEVLKASEDVEHLQGWGETFKGQEAVIDGSGE